MNLMFWPSETAPPNVSAVAYREGSPTNGRWLLVLHRSAVATGRKSKYVGGRVIDGLRVLGLDLDWERRFVHTVDEGTGSRSNGS